MYCYEPDGQEIVIDTLKSPWQLNCQGDFCYRIYKIKIDKFGNIIYDVKQMKWNYVGGYIECRRGEYYITAAKDGFCKIKRDNPSLIKMYGDIPYAETKDVYYIDRNGDGIAEDVTDKPKEKPYKQGLLISTGKPIKLTAPHCLYIFSPKGNEGEFKVPKDDIDKYKVDFKFREKALKNIRNDGDISFWELPKDGETIWN